MTAWHDSFTNGSVENRILQVEYDGTKAYGSTFYWFVFSTQGAFLHVASGWNTTTDQPTGTQYLDYFSIATNVTTNHWLIAGSAMVATTPVDLFRYSSGSNHWFVISQGSLRRCFSILPPASAIRSWIDLDRGYFSGFTHVVAYSPGNRGASISFSSGPATRREVIIGPALVGATLTAAYTTSAIQIILQSYAAPAHINNTIDQNLRLNHGSGANFTNQDGARAGAVILPVGFTASNPAYPANSNPVFHSMPFSPYVETTLNADFGMTFHYATNTLDFQDRFVVDAGVEEWEVLDFGNATIGDGTVPSCAFLARVV